MDENIGGWLSKRAFLDPKMESFIDVASGRRFTFQESNKRANRIANVAIELGLKKGDRVGILMMNGPEYFECFFGLAKVGLVVVPLNWRLTVPELTFILKDSGVSLLIYGAEFAGAAKELSNKADEDTDIRHWLEVDRAGQGASAAHDYDELLSTASEAEPKIAASGDDLLYVMYTSGTTGLPKGVMHSHNTQAGSASATWNMMDAHYGDRMLAMLPFFHVGALLAVIGGAYRGYSQVVMRAFDPVLFWEILSTEKITFSGAVPAMLNAMLQIPASQTTDVSKLRFLISGGAPVPVNLMKRYTALGVEVVQVYGMTENCGLICALGSHDAIEKVGSTGKSFFHIEIRAVDEQGNDVPPNVPGELVSSGPQNMLGYWNRPEATADTLKNGWLHSGDMATIDEEGFVTICDRIKDMVISGGENIYPAELENVILAHENVVEVAVIGQENEQWGEIPVAIVVAKGDLCAQDVIRYCDGKLARFKIPKHVEFVDEIPRNPTGKVLKHILRERFPGP
jgi:acyl-CoA synthetase (AMP-forming)/AMP-acid ligase II